MLNRAPFKPCAAHQAMFTASMKPLACFMGKNRWSFLMRATFVPASGLIAGQRSNGMSRCGLAKERRYTKPTPKANTADIPTEAAEGAEQG